MTDISVIVTSYNVQRYVARAITSALNQEGPSLEVIAIDDASSDDSWATISSVNDRRLRAIRLPRNSGPSVARNAGIAAAGGRWIAVLDGDDAYAPGRLQRCLRVAEETRADIVVDNLMVLREEDGASFPMFPPAAFSRRDRLDLAAFIEGNYSFTGGRALGYVKPIFSADFLRRHGLHYDVDIRVGEDYLLMAEALALGAVCAVEPSAGYLYTARAGSISHRLQPEDMERIAACDRKFLARHGAALSPAARRAQRRRDFYAREARAFTLLVSAIKDRNIGALLHAVRLHPTAVRHLWRPLWVRLRRVGARPSGKSA
jgi:succinoglycan biosynthesis protein ExoO